MATLVPVVRCTADGCHRILTDPVSRAALMGPVCRGRAGVRVLSLPGGPGPVLLLAPKTRPVPVADGQLTLDLDLAAVAS